MNVLFVHQAAELYGSDRVLLALVECFKTRGDLVPIVVVPFEGPLTLELRRLGVEVHVRALAKVQRSAFSPIGLLQFAKLVARSVKELDSVVGDRRIDAVHSNTIAVVSGAVWSRVRRVRHVWHVHEIILRPRMVAKALAWLTYLLSDKVACISGMVRDNLIAQCPRVAGRCAVIPNGIMPPQREIARDRALWRAQMGLDNHLVVGLVGRINAWKGQGLLVRAMRLLLDADPLTHVRFVIVGSAPPGQEEMLHKLNAQIASLGVGSHVQVLEFMPDVWPVWCGMDVAVVPSTDPEPFGMVALEAMCAERPVIAARHGGLADIIVDGVTGLLVPPSDHEALAAAIARLASDAQTRTRMGAAGRQRVHDAYSLQAQGEAFRRLYEND